MPSVPSDPMKELVEIRAAGRPGSVLGPRHRPVRQDDLQRLDDVLDLAVLRRERAHTPRSDPPANRGTPDGLRVMATNEAAHVELIFIILPEHAGLGGRRERVFVHLEQLVHALHVDDDSAAHRENPADGPRGAAGRDHRNAVVRGDPDDLLHIPSGARVDHHLGQIGNVIAPHPLERGWHDVVRVADQIRDARGDVALAHHRLKLCQNDGIDLDRIPTRQGRFQR